MSARFVILTAGLLAFAAPSAQALELKNVRISYGPLGATRTDMKFLPGDVMLVNFDMDGLKLDANNKASYIVKLEVFDSKAKQVYQNETPNVTIPQLGGGRWPSDFHIKMGTDHPAGQYTARLTVMDVHSKDVKSFNVTYQLLPKGFGIVGVHAMTVGFLGQPYILRYTVVDFGLDANKKPNAKLELKIFDEADKLVSEVVQELPKDLPDDIDLKKANFLPLDFPIFPNRPGRFTVEIKATDNSTAPKTATIRYPLTILDVGTFVGATK